MALPRFLQTYLPSYNLTGLNLKRDKDIIITPILDHGDTEAVRWLCSVYNLSDIKAVVKNPIRGMWFRPSLSYWKNILGIKIPKQKFELAILNLDPKPSRYLKEFFERNVAP